MSDLNLLEFDNMPDPSTRFKSIESGMTVRRNKLGSGMTVRPMTLESGMTAKPKSFGFSLTDRPKRLKTFSILLIFF